MENKDCVNIDELDEDKYYLKYITQHFPVKTITYDQIKYHTRKDKDLSGIFYAVRNNCLHKIGLNENTMFSKPYKIRCSELSIQADILLWGCRVIIPFFFIISVLYDIHSSHMGIVK